jgi:hypothetical protein
MKITNADKFAQEFLDYYLERGFGSLTKRECDILVMALLERHTDIAALSNNSLSTKFKLTEARVRNLRYESKLKYPPENTNYIQIQFLLCLAKSKFEEDKGRIVFVMEDVYLRQAIQAKLKEDGMFGDGSFNSEIIKINKEFLGELIKKLYGVGVKKQYDKEFKNVLDAKSKVTYAEMKKIFLTGAATGFGKGVVGLITTALGGI